MKQKHYRVTLYPKANFIADKVALMAVKSNGCETDNRMTLPELQGLFKFQVFDTPATGEGMVCTIEGHTLTIDQKKGESYICLLAIEEVELCRLEPEEPPYL